MRKEQRNGRHPRIEPSRPTARAKFVYRGAEKFEIRGVTYGTFRSEDESGYPTPEVVTRDFDQMAAHEINAIRTYTVPPRWLLDMARERDLMVMVGVPWEQHVAFLEERAMARSIERRVAAGVRACAEHPAVLCYAVGNEIPAPIARWHGRRRVEAFLERLYLAAKEADPEGLVTYVNYPSTEYLSLPFLDLACFNVYLESQPTLEAYLARLHNMAGDKPLLMAEIGLDSRRNGLEAQAEVLAWQIETARRSGCAGAFVFSWTDEWHRGGYDIEDWDFGLTTRARHPKAALPAARRSFKRDFLPEGEGVPRISIVVCAYNAAPSLAECLDGVSRLEYPNFEAIVVDDGSTDATAEIAGRYPCRVISTPNLGLSSARNTGIHAAQGEIVAFLDSDASPDPQWLTYLARSFLDSSHVGIGGPNVPPPPPTLLAQCIADAPGSPVHVLISDREAEHIPGCNCAYRKQALQAIGGFDPTLRVAGDDVDVCWRLADRGWTLGFHPAAVIWHHRRETVRAYWRQQKGYGAAEALLENKWQEKYNCAGHLHWRGRMYGAGLVHALSLRRSRVHHGVWGTQLFQSLYEPSSGFVRSLPLMPEWYLLILFLSGLSALGALWRPLLLALPLVVLATATLVVQAAVSAAKIPLDRASWSLPMRAKRRALTTFFFLLQPAARLRGRLTHGLTPWRRRTPRGSALPRPCTLKAWSETWREPHERLESLEDALRSHGAAVWRGGEFDRWDLAARGGALGGARARVAVEDHGGGRQLMRIRIWPRWPARAVLAVGVFAALASAAGADGAGLAAGILAAVALILLLQALRESAAASAAIVRAGRAACRQETTVPASRPDDVPGTEGVPATLRDVVVIGAPDLVAGVPDLLAREA